MLALYVPPWIATGTSEHAEMILQHIGGVIVILNTVEVSFATVPSLLIAGNIAPSRSAVVADGLVVATLTDTVLQSRPILAVDMPVVLTVVVTVLAVSVEAGSAGDGIPVVVEVAVVDHVVTVGIAGWAVDSPEARVGSILAGLPETLGVEGTAS